MKLAEGLVNVLFQIMSRECKNKFSMINKTEVYSKTTHPTVFSNRKFKKSRKLVQIFDSMPIVSGINVVINGKLK